MVYRTSSPLLGALLVLAGCQTGLYQDYQDDTAKTDDTGDSTVDTQDTEDTEDTQDTDVCHPADPIGSVGWTKTFTISYQGAAGTETMTGMGADTTSTGVDTFRIESHLVAGSADLTSEYYRACGDLGDALWEQTTVVGTVTRYIFGLPIPQVTAVQYRRTPSVHEQYLPDLATLRGIGLWSYDYQLMIEGSDGSGGLFGQQSNCQTPAGTPALCVPVSGNYTVFPAETITVPAGTFMAYKILDQRTELWTQAASGGGGGFFGWFLAALGMPGMFSSTDKEYVSWLYYVEGVGLVKEETYNADNTQVPQLTRELASATGLPPS